MTHDAADKIAWINAQLKERLLRRLPEPGLHFTPIEGLRLSRRNEAGKPEHCFDKPLVSCIIQGGKRAVMGSAHYEYGENESLVVGVDMPNAFQVTAATPEKPFLAVGLSLDRQLTAQLMAETSLAPEPEESDGDNGNERGNERGNQRGDEKGDENSARNARGVSVAKPDAALLDVVLRLVDVLDTEERIPVLAPMLLREIHYLLLTGPHGPQLRRINTFGTQSNQVSKAIAWMRDNFRETVQIETLARQVNMGTSTFHRHFKELTSLSPLQYQKRLRLYEAQRLMLVERHDANRAGLAVGYESTAQFSREYKRLFGEPPLRDVRRLR